MNIKEKNWRDLSFYLKDDSIWKKRKTVLKHKGEDQFKSYISYLNTLNKPSFNKQFLHHVIKFSKLINEDKLHTIVKNQSEPLQFVFVSIANLINHEIEKSYQNIFSKYAPEISSGLSDDIFSKILDILMPALKLEYKVYLSAYDYNDERNSLIKFVVEAANSEEWIEYFFEQYPVAATRIENLIKNYSNYVSDFFIKLKKDEKILKSKFGTSIGSEILKINTGLGDLHNSSKSTIKIIFKNRTTLYYKPRNLKSEEVFYKIYDQLLTLGLKRSIVKTESILKNDYAWQLGIEPVSINKFSEAGEFYFNQGITAAIAYIFNIQDLISDNIIAVGKYAALIDLEIFMHPKYIQGQTYKTNSISGDDLLHSVIKTGLIPQFGFESVNNPGKSNSGISVFETENGYDSNLPILENEIVPIDQYCANFEKGFVYAYNFFRKYRNEVFEIIASNELIEKFKIRTIIRYTYKYSILGERLNNPDIIQDHVAYANVIEFLWRGYNKSLLSEKIIQSEIDQIFQDDVPLFYTWSNSRDLFSVNGELLVENYFSKTGIELAKEKLIKLCNKDLKEQVNIIRRSLIIHNEYKARPELKHVSKDYKLIDQIRKTLRSLNNTKRNNQFSYIDFTITKDSLWSQDIQDSDIFQGIPGLGVFFIASYATFKKKSDLDSAVTIFNQTIEYLQKTQIDVLDNPLPSLGIVNYPISILYMNYLYNEIYPSDKFILSNEIFKFILDFINLNINKDNKKDYLFGSVGVGLLLMRIYEKKQDEYIYDTIINLADNLINSKTIIDNDRITWESSSHDKWGGFAHGTASTAYFLFKMHHLTKDNRYFNDAIKALNYDQSLFNINLGFWQKTMDIVGDRHHGWSNGDAGIGLGRFLCRKYYSNSFLEEELDIVKRSLENVIMVYLNNDQSLCSGFMGCVEIYSLLFEGSDKPKLWLESFEKKIKSISDLRSGGWYQNQEITGVYYGISGIGYNYLKIKFNEKLPSLLFL